MKADRLLKPEVLGRIPLLSSLSAEELAQIAKHMRVEWFNKGEYVVHEGGDGNALMFLLTGRLQVFSYTHNGKEIGLHFLVPGNFFGELSLIDGQPRSASVKATDPSSVAFLERETALRLIYGRPALAEHMLKHLARTIRELTKFRELLAIPKPQQRVVALLKELKVTSHSGNFIVAMPTQQQIASMIDTIRETVSRTLAKLQRSGILEKKKNQLIILDEKKLEKLLQE